MRQSNLINFYSNDMVVSKDHINLNYLKLTYQRISLKDLENKHKLGWRYLSHLIIYFLLNELSTTKNLWTQKYGFVY